MTKIQITTDYNGRLTSSAFAQIQSSLGSLIGKQLAQMALPEIQRQIQRHVDAQPRLSSPNKPIRFIRIADYCAKSKPANPPLRLANDYAPLTPDLTMRPVISSSLRQVGFNAMSRTLRIEFKTGSIWEYLQVPATEHEKLMKAESPGGYFHSHIRNRFQSRKIS